MGSRIIGIMGAMPEEINGIIALLINKETYNIGMRQYFVGELNGIKTVVVFSRWGKVAAATTVSTLILKFEITEIIFTGVAGAVNSELNIGDIVIGSRFIQHDLDAAPLMEEFEIPLLGIKYIDVAPKQLNIAKEAVRELLDKKHLLSVINESELSQFGITKPQIITGDIASGDKFFASITEKNKLLQKLPNTLCVEMEGAAVAQVCYEYGIPFTIIRTISDTADESSEVNFPAFIERISNVYSSELIKKLVR